MGRLERGKDAFGNRKRLEAGQRLLVGGGHIGRAAGLLKVRVLRTHAGIVEAGGDAVGFADLPLVVLQHHGARAVQQTPGSARERRAMASAVEPAARRFDPDEAHRRLGNEGVEDPDRVASSPDAGHDRVGQSTEFAPPLPLRLPSDDRLKVPDEPRKRVRAGDRPQQVVGGGEAPGPVAKRLVDRVLEGAGAGGHRDHFGARQLHPLHIGGLADHVLLPHVNDRVEPEPCGDHRGGGAVLAGAGLGDQPGLPHPSGQKRLPEHIVGLVRASVQQVLALEEHLEPRPPGEPGHAGERGRPSRPGARLPVEFLAEPGGSRDLAPGRLELVERRHEEFRCETPAERTERADAGPRCPGHDALQPFSRSKNRRSRSGSFTPGADSTPLERSTPHGR